MKKSFSTAGFLLFLITMISLLLSSGLFAATDYSDYIVKDLKVTDDPNDDGSGLIVSWTPLPKEKRIIEYRVYRGTSPDSLFFVQSIEVNVKTGVSGKVMYYYDKDYNYFVDIQAPGKLKREKGLSEKYHLYKRYPRDVSVTGPQLKNYDVLGVIKEKEFLYHAKKIVKDKDGEKKYYAGMKLYQVDMYKKLKPDTKYYYTVLTVSETRKYYPPAKPVWGIPRDNAPEKPSTPVCVYYPDLSRLQFEWKLPQFRDDIYHHMIYLLKKDDKEKFDAYVAELKKKELNDLAIKEDSTVAPYEVKLKNPAQLIFVRESANPYTSMNYAKVEVKDGKILDADNDIDVDIDVEHLDNYYFMFSLDDYSGYQSFSDFAEISYATAKDIPTLPTMVVKDRPKDKGDYNLVMWGKPVVYITNSYYKNDAKTKLVLNYDYFKNDLYKIKNIFFDIYDDKGNLIKKINEYYFDKKIIVKLPNGAKTKKLFVKISLKCNKPVGDNYTFSQTLEYDKTIESLKPSDVFFGNENMTEYRYYVYKVNKSGTKFHLAKKFSGLQRQLNDNIRYEGSFYVLVSKYDKDKNLFLVSPDFSVTRDEKNDATVRASLFRESILGSIKKLEDKIAEYKTKIDSTKDENKIKSYQSAIEYYEKQIKVKKENPIIKKALSFKNDKDMIKYLQKVRDKSRRSYKYKIVKTDGKGHFAESDVYKDKNGSEYFFPLPNWLNTDMIPALIATLIFASLVFVMVSKARRGHDLYIRPIAGIEEIDNAIGRATEMGRPILFVPGLSGISDVATLAGLGILSRVAKKAAEYDTRILVPVRDYIVLPIAQEIIKEAHYEAGRPDSYDKNSAFFITTAQFAFVAGVNGIMIREKTATNFYMGMFWAEALIMTETGAGTGAIQISGTDAITQIPFFITTCDYTLIGEELYAASAYLVREPLMLGTLKAQDYTKLLIIIFIVVGAILSSAHFTALMDVFPEK